MNAARKHARFPARVSGPSTAVRLASESVRTRGGGSEPQARVAGPADDIKAKIKDHIKQYVIDNSTAGDDSTASYLEIWKSRQTPGTGGLSRDQVNSLLADSGAWDSLSSTEQHLVCKCVSPGIDDLGKAVLDDFAGGHDSGLTWQQFKDGSGLPDLPPPPPPPDVEVTNPDGSKTMCPAVRVFGELMDIHGDRPPSSVPAGTPLAGVTATDSGIILPYWEFPDPSCAPGKAAEAPGSPKGGLFSGMHVADRFRGTATPQNVPKAKPQAPAPAGISDTKMEAAAFGIPTAIGAVAAIRYGWLAFAAGGAVGVVAATGIYIWSRVTAKKS